MQDFLSASDLNISEDERRALVKVLGMLDAGQIRAETFDMSNWDGDCGMPCCLGGWACKVGDDEDLLSHTAPWADQRGIDRLCFPGGDDAYDAYDATPQQAAVALRNFLTTGQPRWHEAMRPMTSALREETK